MMWPFKKPIPAKTPDAEPIPKLACSFCGKNQNDVRKLIAGPKVYICDECVDLCNDIIAEECDHEPNLAGPERVPDKPMDPLEPGEEKGQKCRSCSCVAVELCHLQ